MSTVPSPSHSFLLFSMNSSAVNVNTISYFGYTNIAQNLENKRNYLTCKHFCGFLTFFFCFFFLVTVVSLQIYLYVCYMVCTYMLHTFFASFLIFWKMSHPQFVVSSLLSSILSLRNLFKDRDHIFVSL